MANTTFSGVLSKTGASVDVTGCIIYFIIILLLLLCIILFYMCLTFK